MKEDQDVSDLKIQVYDKNVQQEQENLKNNDLQREKFEEEFYDFFKKEQQEIERKQKEEEEQRKKDYENHFNEEREKLDSEEEEIKINEKELMNEIISLMRQGKTRQEAADEVGVKINIVNEWYNKGSNRINGDYLLFYKDINEIESKHDVSDNTIKCVNCGKYYDSDLRFCPHCGKPKLNSDNVEVNYCENCGTKITEEDLYYCTKCGHPLYGGDENYNSTDANPSDSKKNQKDKNKQYLFNCCLVLFGVFMFIAFLLLTNS